MRLRTVFFFTTLVAALSTVPIGCAPGTDVKVATPTGDVKPSPPTELKGDAKKAIGPGSSANMKRNPGASN